MVVKPLKENSDFVAYIYNIDLTREVPKELALKLDQLINKFAVLVFPNQFISDSQQVQFTELFGEIEVSGSKSNITKPKDRRLSTQLADVSNIDKNSKLFTKNDPRRIFNLGNRLWHSDSSFKSIPAKYSILSGKTVTKNEGNTEFADMRAAYDSLSSEMKMKCTDLFCEHSLIYSRQRLGFDMVKELSPNEIKNFTPVEQPLVRINPMTNRKSLFLSSHIGKIRDWLRPDSMCFIDDLIEFSTKSELVYTHRWNKNDLVMWDNRQTMHRVRAFDDTQVFRDMRRTTVLGEEKLI